MSHNFAYQWYPSQDLLESHGGRTTISYPMYTHSADETRSPLSQTSVATDGAETTWDGARVVHFDSESTSVTLGSESAGDPHDYAPISSPMPYSSHVPSPAPTPTASSPPTSVKIEPDDPDSRFIMDLAAYPSQSTTSSRSSPETYGFNEPLQLSVPPTEVPLRATQASKEMRCMMGVFRLNPFSMHNLSRGGDGEDSALGSPTGSAAWCGEAGPLEEEPVMLEFQLDIIGLDEGGLHAVCSNIKSAVPGISADEESQLRPFSPSFELQEGDISEWQENQLSDPDQRFEVRNDRVANAEKDLDDNDRHRCSWEDGVRTDSDSTSSSVSVQTPLNETSCSPFHNVQNGGSVGGCEQTHVHSHSTPLTVDIPSSPEWNAVDMAGQYETSPSSISAALGGPRLNFAYSESPHREQRTHSVDTANSHPYLRKNLQNYSISPTHPPHPYPQTYSHSISHQEAQPNVFALNMPQPTSYQLRRMSIAQDPTTPENHISPTTPHNLLNQQQQHQHPHNQTQHHQHHGHHQYQQQQLYSGHYAQMSSVGGLPVSTNVCVRRSSLLSGFGGAAGTGNGQPNSGQSYVTMRSPGTGRGPRYTNRFEELEGEQERYASSPHSPTSHTQQSHNVRSGERLYPTQQQHHHHQQQQEHLSHHHHHHHQQEASLPSSPLGHGHGQSHGVAATTNSMSMRGVAGSPVAGNQNLRRWSLPEAAVQHHHIGHIGAFLGHSS